MPAATLRRISMKAIARYQVILLGEQRHIRCEQYQYQYMRLKYQYQYQYLASKYKYKYQY